MIGDLILWFEKTFKKQTCKHKYKWVNASYKTNGSCLDFKECVKCGKIK